MNESPKCLGCRKTPKELIEYRSAAHGEGVTPDAFVRSAEGTYNRERNIFYCSHCYIKAGMPVGKAGEPVL